MWELCKFAHVGASVDMGQHGHTVHSAAAYTTYCNALRVLRPFYQNNFTFFNNLSYSRSLIELDYMGHQ